MTGTASTAGAANATSSAARTVNDAMIRTPKTWGVDLGLDEARELLADTHLHAVLLVEEGHLRGVVVADDCVAASGPDGLALSRAHLAGRTVVSGSPLSDAERLLSGTGRRRLAVVDDAGDLVGLLCLKRRRDGFCTEEGVEARRRERAQAGEPGSASP